MRTERIGFPDSINDFAKNLRISNLLGRALAMNASVAPLKLFDLAREHPFKIDIDLTRVFERIAIDQKGWRFFARLISRGIEV